MNAIVFSENFVVNFIACIAGGMREWASGPQYSVTGEACEDFASGEAVSEIPACYIWYTPGMYWSKTIT